MTTKTRITTNAGAPATGTYSQAIRAGQFVYVTGQTGRGQDGNLVQGVEAQTRQMLVNVTHILEAAGCTVADVVKVTLIMADLADFKAIDGIYAEWLPIRGVTPTPARTAFAALALPAGARVMLDATALIPEAMR